MSRSLIDQLFFFLFPKVSCKVPILIFSLFFKILHKTLIWRVNVLTSFGVILFQTTFYTSEDLYSLWFFKFLFFLTCFLYDVVSIISTNQQRVPLWYIVKTLTICVYDFNLLVHLFIIYYPRSKKWQSSPSMTIRSPPPSY